MMNIKDRKKYNITATTKGFAELQLALHKAAEEIGWKSLTAELVKFCVKNQPDQAYSLDFWLSQMPKGSGYFKKLIK